MPSPIVALDHVQLAIPPQGEEDADAFYCGVLGLVAVPKPEPLAARGGRWYRSGAVQLHLGLDPDFKAAKKAHPALVVDDLDDLVDRLQAHGAYWRWDEELAGVRRGYTEDPFGNRIELIAGGAPAAAPR